MADKPLKKSIVNFYGLPSFGFQMMVNLEVFYFVAFLTDFAQMQMATVTAILVITSAFDILWVPTSGVILEKSNMKWGKYRSWLLVGPPVALLFYVLQYTKIGSPTFNAVLITVGFVVSHLVWNTYYTAHVSMANSMTQVREERIAMSSNRGMFNAIGAIAFSLVGMPMILFFGKDNPAMGYTITALIGATIMMLCYWTLFKMTKEYAFSGTSVSTGAPPEKLSSKEMIQQITYNPPLIGLMLGEVGRYIGRFVIFGLAFYYFKYVVDNIAVITIFMTGLSVVTLIGAMISGPLAKKLGERNTYILSLSMFIIGLLIVWLFPMNYISFMAVMFVAYFGYGIPDALGVAMYSNTVEYGEWKTGKNARGFIMSLLQLPIKSAVLLRSVMIPAILGAAGYVADMAPNQQLVDGVVNGISLIPAIIMAVGLFFMIVLYKVTPESLKKMQDEIAARKAGAKQVS